MSIIYVSVTNSNEIVIDEKSLKLNGLTIEHGRALMTTATEMQLKQKYGCVPKFNLPEEERIAEEEEDGRELGFHKPTLAEICDEVFCVDDEGNKGETDGYIIIEETILTLDQERERMRKKKKEEAERKGQKYRPETLEELQDEMVEKWLADKNISPETWAQMIKSK